MSDAVFAMSYCIFIALCSAGFSYEKNVWLQEKYGIEPTMVVHGVKMLYVPVMPGHSKRLKLT